MLGCMFSLETYAENVRVKAIKCSLKTADVPLGPDRHMST